MSEDLAKKLEDVRRAVQRYDRGNIAGFTEAALEGGAEGREVRSALFAEFDSVRKRLMTNAASIPEFLLCIDTVTIGLEKITSTLEDNPGDAPTVVIGVVEGDPHDLGKSIIAGIYGASGYRVIDLGSQVPGSEFVRRTVECGAAVLALSAMMSTTMGVMPEIISEVRVHSPETAVMIGGAPLDEGLAERYGADGYAESAVTVLEATEAVLRSAARERA